MTQAEKLSYSHTSETKDTFNTLFERAVIALSYSAANRILSQVNGANAAVPVAYILFLLSLTMTLVVMNHVLLQNSGVQILLSILISKLMTSSLPLHEGQKSYIVFVSDLFYLILISSICWCIDNVVRKNAVAITLWERIVPFVILFTSAIVLKTFEDSQQSKLLYFISFCYIVMSQLYVVPAKNGISNESSSPPTSYHHFFVLFLDSIMCRAVVLCMQDYAKSRIDNMDVAVIVFNASIVILGDSFAKFFTLPTQIHYCLGVLVFTISRQAFAILQKHCNDDKMGSFIVVVTLITMLFYSHSYYNKSLYNVCIICLSLAWTLVLEQWLTSFYNILENLIIYFILFILIQRIKETMLMLIDFSEGVLSRDHLFIVYGYEEQTLLVIPHDTSSSVGLPPSA